MGVSRHIRHAYSNVFVTYQTPKANGELQNRYVSFVVEFSDCGDINVLR